MKKKQPQLDLDSYTEELFKSRITHDGRESLDAVFLAGFRNKLETTENEKLKVANIISAWSWKASPVAALLSAMLFISLFSMSGGTGTDTGSIDELFWESAASGDSEISQTQFLEALFYGKSER